MSDICAIMSDMKTTRISVRLDRRLRASIQKRAKAAGKNEGEMIRETLEKEFKEQRPQKSCYDLGLALGLIGCCAGAPSDLSHNDKYMEGFGES